MWLQVITKYYNYKALGHKLPNCTKLKNKWFNHKDPCKVDSGISDANITKSLQFSSTSNDKSKSRLDCDFTFVVNIVIVGHAHVAKSLANIWFTNNNASMQMIDCYERLSNINYIFWGVYTIQIANNTKLWVKSCKNIGNKYNIDSQYQNGIFHDVLYVLGLKRTLFFVGLVSKRNLSFITYHGQCKFKTQTKKKIFKRIGLYKLYQLNIKFIFSKDFVFIPCIDDYNK